MRRGNHAPPESDTERCVDPTELSEEELERVAGGLERAWTERTSSGLDGRLGEGRRERPAPGSAEEIPRPPGS
jgi:hypothetical protein